MKLILVRKEKLTEHFLGGEGKFLNSMLFQNMTFSKTVVSYFVLAKGLIKDSGLINNWFIRQRAFIEI